MILNLLNFCYRKLLPLIIICLANTDLQAQIHPENESTKLKLTFDQNIDLTIYENLGFFRKFKNTLTFYNNKLEMSFSGNLVEQGLANSFISPDLQLQTELELTYKLRDNLSINSFGKYITNPLNNGGNGQTRYNPLFEQSEIGLEVKTELQKNIQLEVGDKILLDNNNLNLKSPMRVYTRLLKKF